MIDTRQSVCIFTRHLNYGIEIYTNTYNSFLEPLVKIINKIPNLVKETSKFWEAICGTLGLNLLDPLRMTESLKENQNYFTIQINYT